MVSFSKIGVGDLPDDVREAVKQGGDDFATAVAHVSEWFVSVVGAMKKGGSGVVPHWNASGLGPLVDFDDESSEARAVEVCALVKQHLFPICGKATEQDATHLAGFMRVSLEMIEVSFELFGSPPMVRDYVQIDITRRFLVVQPRTTNQAVWIACLSLMDFAYSIGLFESVFQAQLGPALRSLFVPANNNGSEGEVYG